MSITHRRAGAAVAVLTAAATALCVSTAAANAASATATSASPVQATVPLGIPAALHFSIPASFRRVTATTRPSVRVGSPVGSHPAVVGPRVAAARPGLKNTEYSNNWSGYVVDAGGYSSVESGWTQPGANCSGTGGATTDAAFWVGIDGFGSDTVEQTGSDAVCENGSPSYGAWFEAYPNPSYGYEATVEPGDQFEAFVYAPGDSFEIFIEDVTQGWYGEQNIVVGNAAKASAEVIAEAPSSNGILPLTNFGTVAFSGAEANGVGLSSLSPIQLDMESTSGVPEATTSALPSTNAFSITWDSE